MAAATASTAKRQNAKVTATDVASESAVVVPGPIGSAAWPMGHANAGTSAKGAAKPKRLRRQPGAAAWTASQAASGRQRIRNGRLFNRRRMAERVGFEPTVRY